uniref:BTB domain-containing protein n=1 Tax=Ditylenchus dipsaci TaxID=166011 RepID=A0A915DK41_9BILA
MFRGPFCEKDKDEIELKNVKAVEFLYLLEAMYPSEKSPKRREELFGRNAEIMLRMASFYQVKYVTKQCVDYLKQCPVTEVPMEKKLVLAQNFHLSELMDHCIATSKTLEDQNAPFHHAVFPFGYGDQESNLRKYLLNFKKLIFGVQKLS